MSDPTDKESDTLEEVFETFASDTEAWLAKVTPAQLEEGGPHFQRYVASMREATAHFRAVDKLRKAGQTREEAGLMPLRPRDLCDVCLQPLAGPHCCTCGLRNE